MSIPNDKVLESTVEVGTPQVYQQPQPQWQYIQQSEFMDLLHEVAAAALQGTGSVLSQRYSMQRTDGQPRKYK